MGAPAHILSILEAGWSDGDPAQGQTGSTTKERENKEVRSILSWLSGGSDTPGAEGILCRKAAQEAQKRPEAKNIQLSTLNQHQPPRRRDAEFLQIYFLSAFAPLRFNCFALDQPFGGNDLISFEAAIAGGAGDACNY
ncbi:MAG TPA: hypothetical protein VG077_15630 [Verrucomicrobiae bacterium]|nr:hypothetical protein [Verrucomicrobiae bacterium]